MSLKLQSLGVGGKGLEGFRGKESGLGFQGEGGAFILRRI